MKEAGVQVLSKKTIIENYGEKPDIKAVRCLTE